MENIKEQILMKQVFNLNKRTLFFATLFVLLIIAPIALNQYYNYKLAPLSPTSKEETIFVITPGQPITDIAKNLKEKSLIKNTFIFRLLVAQMGIGKSIQAGDFKLSPSMSSKQIAEILTHGAIDIWITLPEGLRIEEQADRIEQKLKFGNNEAINFDKKAYLKEAREGYMFPDTYLIPRDVDAKTVINQLENTFRQKVEDPLLQTRKNKDFTDEEIIILASLIEREAKTKDEKATIAGIITNRIKSGMPLEIDATVQYAKGFDGAKSSWWPQITQDDYKAVKSPFNTYLSVGLPPAPISNPGIDSIKAAISPDTNNYYYYLHDTNGNIHYAKTLEEHIKNQNR